MMKKGMPSLLRFVRTSEHCKAYYAYLDYGETPQCTLGAR